jgi:hypothetical protein
MSRHACFSSLRIWRFAAFVLLVTLASSRAAHADTWSSGQVITYSQNEWGTGGSASPILDAQFFTVYPSATVITGDPTGFVDIFDNPTSIKTYLGSGGPQAPLTATYIDPTSDGSGSLGGDVLALTLNVDFSAAGATLGSSGVSFGDLILTGSPLPVGISLDGLTVQQVLSIDDAVLGGTVTISAIDLANLDDVTAALDQSFAAGTPSTFAQDYLVAPGSAPGGGTTVPEPPSALLLGMALLGLSLLQYRTRNAHPMHSTALESTLPKSATVPCL